jgi:hypothetical protein
MIPICNIQLRWLTNEEGGRATQFRGTRYTPTARFVGEQHQFSIVVEFPTCNEKNPTKGTLRLVNPDLVEIQRRLRPGVPIEIMEGARVVAHCVVESLDGAVVEAGRS